MLKHVYKSTRRNDQTCVYVFVLVREGSGEGRLCL